MKLIIFLTTVSLAVFAQAKEKTKAPHCASIAQACKKAGFKGGDWKNGDGLILHCVDPILGRPVGKKTPPLKQGLVVPKFSASDVSACLSENPNFGQGKAKAKK